MTNLIDMFEQRLKSMPRADIRCEGCQENTASHRCVECMHYLCINCVKAHRNLPLTKAHRIMANEEYETTISKGTLSLEGFAYCSVHPENKIEFFCETCQVPVCTSCTIVKHRIPEHVHRDLKDAADEYRTELKFMVDELKEKEQEAEKNKTLAQQIHIDLTEQCSREERRVRMKAEEIIKKIKSEEQRLIGELKNNYKMKIKRAAVDIDEMELAHGNLKSACSYMETLMHYGNAAQLLSTKGDVGSRIDQLISLHIDTPKQQEGVIFTPNAEICEFHRLGELRSDVCMSKCTVGNIPNQLWKGDSADLLITTRDSKENQVIPIQQVKAKVRKPDGLFEDIDVTDNKDGTYTATVTGRLDGKYQVTVTIGDQPVPGCPAIIPVVKGLVNTIGNKGSGEGQFDSPYGVAINRDKDIVTTDTENNRLQITTRHGKCKKILKFEELEDIFTPCDIAISCDNTYYSLDSKNNRVVISDENGHVIGCFGQNELKNPSGIGISPVDGSVYVTEDDEHCVKIYTQRGQYLRSFGSEGRGQGQFKGPWGVVIGFSGLVFVADFWNRRIQVFNSHDQYLYSFDCRSEDGEMRNPKKLSIDNDKYVYVTAGNTDSVLKFESSGKFVCRIDSDSDALYWPTGVALTDDVPCRVIVADTDNNCIRVFLQ
ncbi:tripartite motif-containing protein 2-like [Ptychodera flava]|uniref:tripartite motif-containing protein 2-like n=1 Tax=Ptychodera flava TaxID=63121 RepID=UPI00396A15F5